MTSPSQDRLYGANSSLAFKAPVKAATTANITLSGAQTVDGVSIVAGDRVLVKDQTVATENGIYEVDSATWSRARDFDGQRDCVRGTVVYVSTGVLSGNTWWTVSSTGINVPDGSSTINFSKSVSLGSTVVVTPFAETLLDDSSAVDMRATLGSGAIGDALFISTSTSAARTTLGAGVAGGALFTSTSTAAARTVLGSGAAGDALFTSTTTAAAKAVLSLGTASTQDTGTSGTKVPLLDGANTWSAAQNITVSSSGTAALTLTSTNTGAVEGPEFSLDRDSTSPAASDVIGIWRLRGRDTSNAVQQYGSVFGIILDPSTGSEDAGIRFNTTVAGSQAVRLHVELGIYTPNATGGDQGGDSINASAVYDDGVLLTCYPFEAANDKPIDFKLWDDSIPDIPVTDQSAGADPARRVDAIPPRPKPRHDRARSFVVERKQYLDIDRCAEFWKTNGHLPSLPSPTEWVSRGKKLSTGEIIQRLWETVEIQSVHIEALNERLKMIELPVPSTM